MGARVPRWLIPLWSGYVELSRCTYNGASICISSISALTCSHLPPSVLGLGGMLKPQIVDTACVDMSQRQACGGLRGNARLPWRGLKWQRRKGSVDHSSGRRVEQCRTHVSEGGVGMCSGVSVAC